MNDLLKVKDEDRKRALEILKEAGIEVEVNASIPEEHAVDEIELYLDGEEIAYYLNPRASGTKLSYEDYVETIKKMILLKLSEDDAIYDAFCYSIRSLCDDLKDDFESIEKFHKDNFQK